MNSRDYAKFKRLFVGPIMPRRIIKQRFYSVKERTPDIRPTLDKDDARRLWDRAAVKKYATPIWANADLINKIYEEAKHLTNTTGIKHEVDHIIPVRHPLVCGLHVETNLRVIPAVENLQKSNHYNF